MLNQVHPMPRHRWRDSLRIAGAVAIKDLGESVRNRTALSFVLTAIFLMLMYRLLPFVSGSDATVVRLVDPSGGVSLAAALEQSDALELATYDSFDDMANRLRGSDFPELGLVAGEHGAPDGPLALTAYVMYWVSDADAADLVARVSSTAAEQLGRPVDIALAEEPIYATTGGTGPTFLFALTIAIVVLFVGLGLVPALMLEEKKEGTLDALLTSPATATTVTAGKAMAGLVMCLAAAAFSIVLYRHTIVQWPVVLLAVLGWSLVSVAAGLLVGSAISVRAQHQVALMVGLPLLAIPVFLIMMSELVPAWLSPLLAYFPSVAVAELLIMGGTPGLGPEIIIPRLAFIWGMALALLALVAVTIRRRSL